MFDGYMRVYNTLSGFRIIGSALRIVVRTNKQSCPFGKRELYRLSNWPKVFSTSNMGVDGDAKMPFKRLPTSVVPGNYQITLQPNLETFKFLGNQIVELEVGNVN